MNCENHTVETKQVTDTGSLQAKGFDFARFLEAINLVRIVMVDDEFDDDDDVVRRAIVTGALGSLSDEQIEQLETLDERVDLGIFDAMQDLLDVENRRAAIRARWNRFDAQVKETLFSILGQHGNRDCANDVLSNMRSSLSPYSEIGVDVIPVSLSEWSAHGMDDVRVWGAGNGVTVILFDRILEAFDGDSSLSFNGDRLAKDVLELAFPNIFCGVLTGEIRDAREVLDEMDNKLAEGELILSFGKTMIADPYDFQKMIGCIVALNALDAVKATIVEQYSNIDAAVDLFHSSLSMRLIMQIAKESVQEGSHAYSFLLDSLARLHGDCASAEVRKICAENKRILFLSAFQESEFEYVLGVVGSDNDDADFCRAQGYIDGSVLFESCFPTDIGDVFEIENVNGSVLYMLLSQPCGLMVRGNGKRSNDPKCFCLVKLRRKAKGGKSDRCCYEVPDVDPRSSDATIANDGMQWCLDFADTLYIAPDILDLCMFGEGGQAYVGLEDEMPSYLVEAGWKKRYDKLKRAMNSMVGEYDDITRSLKNRVQSDSKLQKAISGSVFRTGVGFVSVNNESGKWKYNVKRVARLRSYLSHRILIEYARYQSRPAYPISIGEPCEERSV